MVNYSKYDKHWHNCEMILEFEDIEEFEYEVLEVKYGFYLGTTVGMGPDPSMVEIGEVLNKQGVDVASELNSEQMEFIEDLAFEKAIMEYGLLRH